MVQASKNLALNRIISIITIVLSAAMAYLVNQIDQIVHVQLYGYGLQPSIAWQQPYWNITRIIYICLVVVIVLSAVSLAMSFLSKKKEKTEVQIAPPKPNPKATTPEAPIVQSNVCPKCHKTVTKPIVMLNFEGGKSKLVNVCPYCNHNLGLAEEKPKAP
jgi:hypothetical protein